HNGVAGCNKVNSAAGTSGQASGRFNGIEFIHAPAVDDLGLSATRSGILKYERYRCIRYRGLLVERDKIDCIYPARLLLRVDLIFGTIQLDGDIEMREASR